MVYLIYISLSLSISSWPCSGLDHGPGELLLVHAVGEPVKQVEQGKGHGEGDTSDAIDQRDAIHIAHATPLAALLGCGITFALLPKLLIPLEAEPHLVHAGHNGRLRLRGALHGRGMRREFREDVSSILWLVLRGGNETEVKLGSCRNSHPVETYSVDGAAEGIPRRQRQFTVKCIMVGKVKDVAAI